MVYDLIIKYGRVFDGRGASRMADIGIRQGRIEAIEPGLEDKADEVLDASGLWVCPGLVDIHTHYDLEVELNPGLSESVRHGSTSVVMGGCSLSVIYGEPEDLAVIFSRVETLAPEIIGSWLTKASSRSSPQAYFEHLGQLTLGPNIASMLGHSALRVKVMGLERSLSEHASAQEIKLMRELAEDALDAGCIGISVDMVHWHKVSGKFAGTALPSHHAAFEEYAMLADVCRSRDAVFQVTPNPENFASFLNILRLSPGIWRAPLRNTILAALDMDGAPLLWRVFPLLLFVCNKLLGCNIRFQTLAEPFTIYADGHITPLFEEFSAGIKLNNSKTREQRQALWRDVEFRQEFRQSWSSGWRRTFHRDLYRMQIVAAPDTALVGKTIGQAAEVAEEDALEYFMSLLEQYDTDLRWVGTSANIRDEVRHKLIKHPHILPGFSDAGAHSRNLAFFDNGLSVIRQAVSVGFMSAERAVARVSGEAAAWFNLDVGRLVAGAKADITILDPQKLRLPIPEAEPFSDPVLGGAVRMVKRDTDPAVAFVLINGVQVVRQGEPLAALGRESLGSLLRQLNPARSQREALRRFRNRISDDVALPAESRYWDVFLLKHQHPMNVYCHCFGFVLMYAVPALALVYGNPWLLAFWPLSQAVGLLGHRLFEPSPVDQRDALFSWRALLSLHRMFILVLGRGYQRELGRARRHSAAAQH
ncbi:MAG: amidohydrolase family protein [Gammaproteobacteria bacterium]|nr:amidohydrolase family protein [Gammaproteobacteria bacterium]MDH3447376.1 amidohydrolase family protein [Gammaproteobacteria bacterium]